ncbi:DUF5719 family protein [Kitasatospora purpeofusca]|uniref:DUF5719 family protein n=1 Tax=Kitasatospora purpeofusca TaxID=67352 RepID=UPI00225198A5|nr:DUF5719 family protein [Kitasatospora purpeofusca]MCX4753089.1 DUF5719 family protein [Kitasatospora purpeofusca]WSR32619.1 DUF5719 family protein [Kitasatospora purpeofusca]WSR40709.1 DUF5719 family protein [Kitasatospora purpeofusca]
MKKPAFRKKSGTPDTARAAGGTGTFDGAPAGPAPAAPAAPRGSGAARTTRSLLAAAVVLAAVFGIAELRKPAAPAATDLATATSAQVERTAVVCPQPLQGLTGSTTLTAYTPPGTGTGSGDGTAGSGWISDAAAPAAAPGTAPSAPAAPAPATPAAGGAPTQAAAAAADKNAAPADARLTLAKPGTPVSAPAANSDLAPGAGAVATGALAPGFTVTQTTTVTEQRGLGLSGITCTPSGTGFWFAGASTAEGRTDYVSLVNAESTAAVVDIKLYGDKGLIENDAANGITVAPGSSQSVLLPTISKGQVADLAVHVVARSGRVGAALHAADGSKGADWVPASADPAPVQVMPGLPADTSAAHLVVWAPPEDDADLKIELSGKNGWFVPAGNESIHVKAGTVASVDLGKVTRDEVAGLRVSPTDDKHPTRVVAGVRVDRAGANGKSDAAWLAGTAPVGARATVADNRGGGPSTLFLTSTGEAATVRVTASAGTGGGTPTTKEVQLPAGGTVALPAPEPTGLNGAFALTAETVSGGPVVAARMLALPTKDVPMFTVQALRDDRSTVKVPQASQDPGVVLR